MILIIFSCERRCISYILCNQQVMPYIPSNSSQIYQGQSESQLPITYFDLVEKAGSNGKYQKILLVIFILIWYVTGSILLSTAFIYLNPTFDCSGYGLLTDDCYKYVCALSPDQWQDFIIADSNNFQSLANGFDQRFYCDDQVYLNLYSTLPYFGALVGYIIISFYADNKGRKNTTIIGWTVSILGVVMALAAPNITVASIGLFLAGVGTDSATNITLIYFVEVFEARFRQKAMAAISGCFTAGGMVSTLFYYLFKDWWTTTLYSVLVPAVITLILMLIFLQESPMFLLREGAVPAQVAMNKIAKLNTGRSNIITLEDIGNVMQNEQVEQYNRMITPLDLFRFKSLRLITICGGIACVATYMMYYGPILIVGQIGFDIYTTNLVLNLSDLLVYYPLFLIIDKIRRKKSGIILLSIASALSGVLIFVVAPIDCNGTCSEIIVQLALVFVFRYCISMQFAIILIYTNELLPTRARSIGCGIINVFGTMASSASPLVMGAITRAQINPFIVFAMLGLLGAASYTFLNETHQQVIPDQIEEIEFEKAKRRSVKQLKASLQKAKEG